MPDSEDGASATSFDPERAAGGAMASERSFDPDQNDGEHDEQDLSGFDDQQPRNVATISAEVAQRAMELIHEKLHSVTEFESELKTSASDLVSHVIEQAHERAADNTLRLFENIECELQNRMQLRADALGKVSAAAAAAAAVQPFEYQLGKIHNRIGELMGALDVAVKAAQTQGSVVGVNMNAPYTSYAAPASPRRNFNFKPKPVSVGELDKKFDLKMDINSVPPKLYSTPIEAPAADTDSVSQDSQPHSLTSAESEV